MGADLLGQHRGDVLTPSVRPSFLGVLACTMPQPAEEANAAIAAGALDAVAFGTAFLSTPDCRSDGAAAPLSTPSIRAPSTAQARRARPIPIPEPSAMTAPMPPDLLVIAASNGANLQLAERFANAARQQGQSAAVLDLTTIALPLFTPRAQLAGSPPALAALQAQLLAAPRWVICTPEYNGSIPPVLTSAIAWLSVQGDDFRALFNGRPVAIATHSGGGGTTVMAALRLQLAHLGAHVVGRQLVSNSTHAAKDESITDLITRLHELRAP